MQLIKILFISCHMKSIKWLSIKIRIFVDRHAKNNVVIDKNKNICRPAGEKLILSIGGSSNQCCYQAAPLACPGSSDLLCPTLKCPISLTPHHHHDPKRQMINSFVSIIPFKVLIEIK